MGRRKGLRLAACTPFLSRTCLHTAQKAGTLWVPAFSCFLLRFSQGIAGSEARRTVKSCAAAPSGSEPGLAAVDTDGLYAFLQAQLGDATTADCLNKIMANRLPTRIASLSGQPAGLTLQKRSGADHCYDFSADLQAADGTTTASVTGTITMVKEDGAWKASDLTLNLK